MGITPSTLPEISNLVVQFTIFPQLFAMWWYTPHSPLNSVLTVAFLFSWELLVVIGADIMNPLDLYAGQSLRDATLIMCTVLGALAIAYAIIGAGWTWFLGSPELLPWGARIEKAGARVKRRLVRRQGREVYASAPPPKTAAPAGNWGVPGLVPGWRHLFLHVLGFLGAVGVPTILYTWFMNQGTANSDSSQELLAWLLSAFINLPVYLLVWLYNRFAGDDAVWGPGESFFGSDPQGLDYGLTPQQVQKAETKRRRRIALALWPMAFLQSLGFLVLGGVRYYTDDVDNNWLFAVGWFAALLVILCILGLVLYFRRRQESAGKRPAVAKACNEDDYEEDQSPSSEEPDARGVDEGDDDAAVAEPSTGTSAYRRMPTGIHALHADD